MKNQTYIIGGIALFLVLVGVSLFFFFKGKKKGDIAQAPLPDRYDSESGQTLSEAEQMQIREIALALHSDMDGFNGLGHDFALYERYLILSDYMFVAVYNYFNKQFGKGETLREWIQDEVFTFATRVDVNIVSRMNKLGLS